MSLPPVRRDVVLEHIGEGRKRQVLRHQIPRAANTEGPVHPAVVRVVEVLALETDAEAVELRGETLRWGVSSFCRR